MQSVKIETFVPPNAPTTLLPDFWKQGCETVATDIQATAEMACSTVSCQEAISSPITMQDLATLEAHGLSYSGQRQETPASVTIMTIPSVPLTEAARARVQVLLNAQNYLRYKLRGGLTGSNFSAHAAKVRVAPMWSQELKISSIFIQVDMHLNMVQPVLDDAQPTLRDQYPVLIERKLLSCEVPIEPVLQSTGYVGTEFETGTLGTVQSFGDTFHDSNLDFPRTFNAGSGFDVGGMLPHFGNQLDLPMLQDSHQPVPPNPLAPGSINSTIPTINLEAFGANFQQMQESVHYGDSNQGSAYDGSIFGGSNAGSGRNSPTPSVRSVKSTGGLSNFGALNLSRPPSQASHRSNHSDPRA